MKHLVLYESFSNDIWYHGSNNKFEEFDLVDNKTYQEIDLPVWFFTRDLNYAKSYGRHIYRVKLDIHNTFDTSLKEHFEIFMEYLKGENKTPSEIEEVLDEQFYQNLPYWTCHDAYYCAVANGFDSILIAEELEGDVQSVGVFNKDLIAII